MLAPMGEWATAKRAAIVKTFEAGSGDMRGDVEPVFIERRADRSDAITAELTRTGDTMRIAYRSQLDADDVARVFVIAYLDALTGHHYQRQTRHLVFVDTATGAERTMRYPDPE